MMTNGDSIPVTVLTGFLGSGKTTVLNRLLSNSRLSDTAVIINEFGEIGLDHLLVTSSTENLIVLNNGCLCCTVRGDLIQTLRELEMKVSSGAIPPFRRVVIETTGLADPAPILHTLMVDPAVTQHWRLEGVIATVDAVNGAHPSDQVRHRLCRRIDRCPAPASPHRAGDADHRNGRRHRGSGRNSCRRPL